QVGCEPVGFQLVPRSRPQYQPIGSTVYLMPPYCITKDELARAYDGVAEGLDALASKAFSAP
ncbi:MAG: hypothetical protein HC861_07060, partial [Rhodospirillaceae bacterium]|nr:hypothetical protein [Rhodospirillaceae bacterium]